MNEYVVQLFFDDTTTGRVFTLSPYNQRGSRDINHTRDFGIGKLLKNLPALRQIGFQDNRRLLDVQKISHDCSIGEDAFERCSPPYRGRWPKSVGFIGRLLRFAK